MAAGVSSGVTDRYIGGIDTAFNTEIANNLQPERFGPPVVDEGYVKPARTSSTRITEYCNGNDLDPTSTKDRNTVAKILERGNQRQWAQKKTNSLSAENPKEVVQSHKRKTPTTSTLPLAEKSPNARPSKRQKNKDNKPDGGGTTDSGLDAVQYESHPQPAGIGSHASPPDELIDPRLSTMAYNASKIDTSFKDAIAPELRIQGSSQKPNSSVLNDYNFLGTVLGGFKASMNSTLDLAINSAHDLRSEIQFGRSSDGPNSTNLDMAIQQLVKSVDRLAKASDESTEETHAVSRDLTLCMMTYDEE